MPDSLATDATDRLFGGSTFFTCDSLNPKLYLIVELLQGDASTMLTYRDFIREGTSSLLSFRSEIQ